jgi:hypothetical protein
MKEPQEIARIDKARREIAAAKTIDECRKIGDKAEAARYYARKIGMSLDTQNELAEIIIESQARAGEILADMKKNGERASGHAPMKKSGLPKGKPTLSDLGVTEKQSHVYQKVAAVPAAARARYIAESREAKTMATTTGLLKSVKSEPKEKDKPLPKAKGPAHDPDEECVLTIQEALDVCWAIASIRQKQAVGRFLKAEAERIMVEVGDGR